MATVNPLLQQIDAIAKEKGVEPDIIITALQDAIEAAARKRYKTEALGRGSIRRPDSSNSTQSRRSSTK